MSKDFLLTSYTVLDLIAWHEQGELEISPKFQRRGVWKSAARSYFIDSLLSGLPVPPIHVRLKGPGSRTSRREVVDGQQRLRSVFDFVQGKYRLSRHLTASWAGASYEELPQSLRDKLQYTSFTVYQYQGIGDAEVLEIFARLNTYSVKLNPQELRNGRYFGEFKTAVYEASYKYLEFWRRNGIMSEGSIARMAEAELTSELFVLTMDGLQDKKKSLDEFYRQLDEVWDTVPRHWGGTAKVSEAAGSIRPAAWLSREQAVGRFENTLTAISESVGALLPSTEFRRPVLFYTLFAAVYHRIYGLPREIQLDSPLVPLGREAGRRLWAALEALSELLSREDAESVTAEELVFLNAVSAQTDNIGPRRARLLQLWTLADLSRP